MVSLSKWKMIEAFDTAAIREAFATARLTRHIPSHEWVVVKASAIDNFEKALRHTISCPHWERVKFDYTDKRDCPECDSLRVMFGELNQTEPKP